MRVVTAWDAVLSSSARLWPTGLRLRGAGGRWRRGRPPRLPSRSPAGRTASGNHADWWSTWTHKNHPCRSVEEWIPGGRRAARPCRWLLAPTL